MTGGAQGRTGTLFARWLTKRLQSATGSNTKLSLFFYILFLSTYPTFFLFAIWCPWCTKIFMGWVQTWGPRTQCSAPLATGQS